MLLVIYSSRPAIFGKRPHITEEAYQELYKIKEKNSLRKNSIVLTRHGLEWWTGFVFETKIGQDYSLTIDEFSKYDSVYILTQHKGNNFGMLAWSHFLEVDVPETAIEKYAGSYFNLYKLEVSLNYTEEISKPPLTYGKIIEINRDEMLVANELYQYRIKLNPKTDIKLRNNGYKLAKGMQIEIWGKRIPFSLAIKAQTIHEIEGKKEVKASLYNDTIL